MNLIMTFYPWITQHVDPLVIHKNVQIFADEVAKSLSEIWSKQVQISVPIALPVSEQIQSISNGGCHIALMNPLGFIFAHQRNPDVHNVAIAQRKIDDVVGDVYFAQLYVRKDSKFLNGDRLKTELLDSASIGFGVPYSTSNFLIPAYELLDRGIHPFTKFKRIEYVGGHDKVAKAVYNGEVDIGAGHDGVIFGLATEPGFEDANDKLVQVIRSRPIASDPIAVNLPEDQLRDVQNAIVSAGESDNGKNALEKFWGGVRGLSFSNDSAYKLLIDATTSLKLSEKDVLR